MDKELADQVIDEAKRVLKDDGYIFITEDIVENEEEKKLTEDVDRKLNWESKDAEHSYKGDKEWQDYFEQKGLELVDKKMFESESKKGKIKHASYVLRMKTAE